MPRYGKWASGSSTISTTGSVPRTVVRSQGSGASAPQPVGASGQLGKEQALPCAENLFSWCGVSLTEERAQLVLNCLSSFRGCSASSLAAVSATAVRQACVGLYGQHCGCVVHQPDGGYMITPHVTARPPSPPLESHAAQIAARCPHSRGAQSCGRCALMTAHFPGEWRLHPETIRLIWSEFGEAQVDLFASRESSHCQLYFSLTEGNPRHGCTGTQLASGSMQVCISPSETARTDTVQGQGGRGAGPAGRVVLAHPDLVSRTHSPRDSPSLAHSSEEGPPFLGARHHMAPASRPVEHVADLSGLPQAVVETITQARAPSTRQAYALKWSLFANWCSSRREDPRRCTIRVVLSFLQERLERRLSPSTLKVYVAAIVAHHDAVDGRSLGKHDLIVRFLRGARRLNPSRPPLMPSWDLSIVLAGLQRGPFVPLDSVELKYLSAKTALLTALTSIKRVGDLQAFSVSE